jgi:glycosyltransferase involved in cell wall biosynthesis
MKPRLLMAARMRYALPLSQSLERKFAPLRERFDLRVFAVSHDGQPRDDGTFHLVGRLPVLDGPLYWILFPWRLRRLARQHRPDAILVQSPYEAAFARLGLPKAAVLVELHGDWRTATRLYGSPLRRVLSPLADAVGAWGVRRADAVRTLSPYTTRLVRELGREPDAEFVAFMDLELFLDRPVAPLPEHPRALFIGVLELYKNVDGLARAWRRVAARLPDAHLHVVGDGSRRDVIEELVRDLPQQVTWSPRLEQGEVARALDDATVLVLPSRSEGLGRVLIEAFCRGRPSIAARVGGIRDVVCDDQNGVLVDNEDDLVEALVTVLAERELAERLAEGAHATAPRWIVTADEYADKVEGFLRPYTVRG